MTETTETSSKENTNSLCVYLQYPPTQLPFQQCSGELIALEDGLFICKYIKQLLLTLYYYLITTENVNFLIFNFFSETIYCIFEVRHSWHQTMKQNINFQEEGKQPHWTHCRYCFSCFSGRLKHGDVPNGVNECMLTSAVFCFNNLSILEA